MSLVDPYKLIILISDLEELLSYWNTLSLDSLSSIEKLRRESIEVCNLAEKDKNRSIETEETDREILNKSKKQVSTLVEISNKLKQETSGLPNQVEIRVQKWRLAHKHSSLNFQQAEEWLETASDEFQRAQSELDTAQSDYNSQKKRYNAAVTKLNSIPPFYEITKTDIKGQEYKETGPNPQYESARLDIEELEKELHSKKRNLEEKKRVVEIALKQKRLAEEAFSITEDMLSRSQVLLEKSLDVKELAYYAEKSASNALSSAKSAFRLNEETDGMRKKQEEINYEVINHLEKAKSYKDEIINVSQKISEHTNSCCILIARATTLFGIKKSLLHRISAILPDKISPFNLV